MPKYFDAISKRPRIPLPVPVQTESASLTQAATERISCVALIRKDGAAARAEQALRKSSHAFRKFQQATQTYPVESALSEVASDASITLRVAMTSTSELLAHYQTLLKPSSEKCSEQARQRADLSGQILSSVQFEFDCMDALADALDRLQRIDAAKLVVARDIASQAISREAKLAPLLAQHEQQSAQFQAARSKDVNVVAQLIDRRTRQIVEELHQTGILTPD